MLAFFTTDAAVAPPLLAPGARGRRWARASTASPSTATPRRTTCAVVLASGAAGAAPIDRRGPRATTPSRGALAEAARTLARADRARRRGRDAASPRCASRGRARQPTPTASRAPSPSRRSSRRRSTAATRTGAASWPRRAAPASPLDARPRRHLDRRRLGRRGRRGPRLRREAAAAAHARGPGAHPRPPRRGRRRGWMWTCDLSHGYVDINAHYRS